MSKKVALITGGSRGIGRAIVESFLSNDYEVAYTATSSENAQASQDSLSTSYSAKCKAYAYRAENAEAASSLVKNVLEDFGRLDFLINNAGIHDDNLMMRMKDEQWSRVIQTNLEAPFYLSRAVLRPMLKQKGGRIIFISSVVGEMGNVGQANYAAAKSGLSGLCKTLAKEYGPKGITANVVAPGFIETNMIEELESDYLKEILNIVPLKRLGKATEIASLVNYLVSDLSAYITGQVIQVDGGIRM